MRYLEQIGTEPGKDIDRNSDHLAPGLPSPAINHLPLLNRVLLRVTKPVFFSPVPTQPTE
jgi:hypothetical protein